MGIWLIKDEYGTIKLMGRDGTWSRWRIAKLHERKQATKFPDDLIREN